jgi:hypothetical protein
MAGRVGTQAGFIKNRIQPDSSGRTLLWPLLDGRPQLRLSKPRLMDLLKLKVRHVYETTPGNANSKLVIDGCEVEFRLLRTAQPYKNIERFLAADKLISFLVNPGVLPIVKAISMDIRGRKMLVTRKIQARDDDKGVVAHIDHFGIRVMMSFDSVLNEAQVVWESLYGVA